MNYKERQEMRFKEIGRVSANEICSISGILDDISQNGCKIHYQFPVNIDLEKEYELKILPLRNSDENPLNLICKPQWIKTENENTFIGFQILYSPDVNRLTEFINFLKNQEDDNFPQIK